jgi:hypothetical protein
MKYTYKNCTTIFILCTIVYIYCIIFAPYVEQNNTGLFSYIDKMHKKCLYSCKSDQCYEYMINTRGENYFISTPIYKQKSIKKCMFTFWGFTHFIFYLILSFLFPSFYMEFIIIGILFEIYEYYRFNCHDFNDLILNGLGIFIGTKLSPYW